MRRGEEQDVLARQPQLAALARLAHQVPQAVHAAPLLRVLRHVRLEVLALELDHPEHERHRLHQAVGPADLGRRARSAHAAKPLANSGPGFHHRLILAVIANTADNTLKSRNPTPIAMTMMIAGSMRFVITRNWMLNSLS